MLAHTFIRGCQNCTESWLKIGDLHTRHITSGSGLLSGLGQILIPYVLGERATILKMREVLLCWCKQANAFPSSFPSATSGTTLQHQPPAAHCHAGGCRQEHLLSSWRGTQELFHPSGLTADPFWHHVRSAPDAHPTLALIKEEDEQCRGGLGGRSIRGGWTQTTRLLPREGSARLHSSTVRKETPAAASSRRMEWTMAAQRPGQLVSVVKVSCSASLHSA